MWLIAGIAAAIAAYIANITISRFAPRYSVTLFAPFLEEFLKTVVAILIGTDIVLSHTVFGVAEGVYDYFYAEKKVNGRSAVLSVVSHWIFGYITLRLKMKIGVICAIVIVAFIHSLWNIIMMGGKRTC